MKPTENTLTVILRDASPMRHLQDPPIYRTVHIRLTDEQIDALDLHLTDTCGTTTFHETVAQAFLETL